jgi:energy-converting hydrogenase Eha subunit B
VTTRGGSAEAPERSKRVFFENFLGYLRQRAASRVDSLGETVGLANGDIAIQFAAGGAVSGADASVGRLLPVYETPLANCTIGVELGLWRK